MSFKISLVFVCILVITGLVIVGCSNSVKMPPEPGKPGELKGIGSATGWATAMAQYATPIDTFTVIPSSISLQQGESGVVDISIADTVIYNTGYYSIGGEPWISFSVSGSTQIGSWVVGSGSSQITLMADDLPLGTNESYIVLYSCTWNAEGSSWNCHGNQWQIHNVTTTLGCEGNQCFESGTCYSENSGHPQGGSICIAGSWVSLPGDPSGP